MTEPSRPPLDLQIQLSVDRTRLSQERTLLSWVRTATTLITFGFTIYTFFALESGPGNAFATHLGPRLFSLGLIGTGLISLALATIQRRRAMAALQAIYPGTPAMSQAGILGTLMALLGIFGIVVILLRM